LNRTLKIGAAVAVAAGVAWLLRGSIALDCDAVKTWLLSLGPVAPLAYVALYAAQVILAPIPGLPIGAAAGFVFGLIPALVYGTIGLAIGVGTALVAGRLWGLRLLARVAGPEVIGQWERLRLVNSPFTWLAIFLGPSPDLILFVAGMSRIPLPTLFLLGMAGRWPAMAAATFLGVGLVGFGPWLIVGAAVAGVLFCFGGLLLRRVLPQTGEGIGAEPVPVSPSA